MPDNSHLVLAFFPSESEADGAASALRGFARQNKRVQLEAVGVLVQDAEGNVKTHKLGPTESRKGIGIGAVLGLVAGIASGGLTLAQGAALGAGGGGVLGLLVHKNLGMSKEDLERIRSRLDDGHAAVGALVPSNQAPAIVEELEALGGEPQTHVVATAAEPSPAQQS
jgi:uncharacterized membrane protein